jgi:protein-tyrosine phosphatase
MSEIICNKLYLGSMDDVINLDLLLKINVSIVISLVVDVDFTELNNLLESNNIKHYIFKVYDNEKEDLSKLFLTLFKIIDLDNIIFIHCSMGISRSPTITIAYLMYKFKIYLDDATKLVLNVREYIFPNDNFIMQLLKYEKTIFGVMSFTHDKYGIAKYKQMIHSFDKKLIL